MTNEEKFQKGMLVYKTDDDDYIYESWGASTKHPDIKRSMNRDIASNHFVLNPILPKEKQVFQWLCYIASTQVFPFHAKEIVDFAITEWYN